MPWSNQGGADGPQKPRDGDQGAKSGGADGQGGKSGQGGKNWNPNWTQQGFGQNPKGPWGSGGPNPWGGGPGGGSPPDLEAAIRNAQQRINQLLPGGLGGARGYLAIALIGVLLWLASGFYTVDPNQVGLNLVFGRYIGKTVPGLNYNWPAPIGSYVKLDVTDRNAIDVGSLYRSTSQAPMDVPEESLMLTGDENIADVKFRVIWQIDPVRPEDFEFNVKNQVETIKAVAESAMREIVGRTPIQRILTAERKLIEPAAQEAMQKVLNAYQAGVLVLQVQLLSVDPPPTVISAFRDVTAAQQDRSRFVNEAQADANSIVPQAHGEASRILRDAEGYREQTVAEARGQAARYLKVYEEYKKAPEVTRERIYLETMERVLGAADKTILDQGAGGASVLPMLLGSHTAPLEAKP